MTGNSPQRRGSFLCMGAFTFRADGWLDAEIRVKESLCGETPNPKFATVLFGVEYNGQALSPPFPPDEQGEMRYTLPMRPVRGAPLEMMGIGRTIHGVSLGFPADEITHEQ